MLSERRIVKRNKRMYGNLESNAFSFTEPIAEQSSGGKESALIL